ncbi:alpha/beta hydrolase [Lentzea tibetensis]|uniref:Alpha/beta hydrolase n=1 Tax=Lentzea tibetensis TaxID=2591470 RepID=A0A563F070_9PSEU|nr:alpha/beta hydrolase [Lentzea tibetensis]TWP53375.1 alpha/beta hydrolase [Lentzea tibetensis]
MGKVLSADGTKIAYSVVGDGPPLIMVDGALSHRGFGPSQPLGKLLAPHFTFYSYDRRGRGETGDGETPWSIEREIEDIDALLQLAGGSAYLYGISCGAALALEAAERLEGFTRLALYEAPFLVEADSHPGRPDDLIEQIDAMVAAGHPGEALKTFLRVIGWPGFLVTMMVFTPAWKKVVAIAPTLPNDLRIVGDNASGKPLPTTRWMNVKMPSLVMNGGKSPGYLHTGMRSLAGLLGSEYVSIPGQTHIIKPDALAPVLIDFFSRAQRTAGPIA